MKEFNFEISSKISFKGNLYRVWYPSTVANLFVLAVLQKTESAISTNLWTGQSSPPPPPLRAQFSLQFNVWYSVWVIIQPTVFVSWSYATIPLGFESWKVISDGVKEIIDGVIVLQSSFEMNSTLLIVSVKMYCVKRKQKGGSSRNASKFPFEIDNNATN